MPKKSVKISKTTSLVMWAVSMSKVLTRHRETTKPQTLRLTVCPCSIHQDCVLMRWSLVSGELTDVNIYILYIVFTSRVKNTVFQN